MTPAGGIFTPEQIALEPKRPLYATGAKRGGICCLCGAQIERDEWVVQIKGRDAQTHCAADHGWEIV